MWFASPPIGVSSMLHVSLSLSSSTIVACRLFFLPLAHARSNSSRCLRVLSTLTNNMVTPSSERRDPWEWVLRDQCKDQDRDMPDMDQEDQCRVGRDRGRDQDPWARSPRCPACTSSSGGPRPTPTPISTCRTSAALPATASNPHRWDR